MKISLNWLKDYINISLNPKELAHKLTLAGSEVVAIEEKNGDTVFELEITPNRPDCLSYLGIAREVAAITGKKVVRQAHHPSGSMGSPSPEPSRAQSRENHPERSRGIKRENVKADLKIKIEDKTGCPRYSGCLITGVKVAPSPKWLQDKLTSIGLRPVNNVVDITNFVLMETGHPLHAFDADKLKEEVIIRRAKKGETIATIDGLKRNLDENILIIADKNKPVAVAGVMGGTETEVTPHTKNIFLESACFNSIVIRKAARQLALSSDSSYRFERGIDLEGVAKASSRAVSLILELCGGVAGQIQDIGLKKVTSKTIVLRLEKVNNILGIDLSAGQVKKILNSLDLKVSSAAKGALKMQSASFRRDLEKEIDLVEEIARIFGYEKTPLTLPQGAVGLQELSLIKEEKLKKVEEITKETLVALGLNEIITYSLIGKDLLGKANLSADNVISIQNPLSKEQEIMRPLLAPGMFNAVSYNINHKNNNLKLFELGKVYFYGVSKTPSEKMHLSLGLSGQGTGDWQNKPKNFDFFALKGIINTLLSNLGIKEISYSKQAIAYLRADESVNILVGGETVGILGCLGEKTLSNFDLKSNLYFAELDFELIFRKASLKKYFSPLPKYPGVQRDLSLIAAKNIPSENIESVIRKTGGELVNKVKLIDLYFGAPISSGEKGMLYSVEYRTPQKTLTDQEVNGLHQKITSALAEELKIKLR